MFKLFELVYITLDCMSEVYIIKQTPIESLKKLGHILKQAFHIGGDL